jgi:hypothetical protein
MLLAKEVTAGAARFVEFAQTGISWRLKKAVQKLKDERRTISTGGQVLIGRANRGYCPICERKTIFVKEGEWLREHYRCVRCGSIPRWRALVQILHTNFPTWRDLRILESSPGGASSEKLRKECYQYIGAHYFKDVVPGKYKDGWRCENLEELTFHNETFDLVVTQDVFEHILNPAKAFAEVGRVLKPGGAHVFTVPFYPGRRTEVRAADGLCGIRYLKEKIYHGNPIDPEGSLVVTDWGADLPEFIYMSSRMATTIYQQRDSRFGLEGQFLEVFVSRKAVP